MYTGLGTRVKGRLNVFDTVLKECAAFLHYGKMQYIEAFGSVNLSCVLCTPNDNQVGSDKFRICQLGDLSLSWVSYVIKSLGLRCFANV